MTNTLPRSEMTLEQETGVQHLKTHAHSNLWWPMGKGKTVTLLTAIRDQIFSAHVYGALIFAPVRVVLLVYLQEAQKWEHLKHLRISIVRGTPAQRERALMVRADIYITNFENMAWIADTLISKYLNQGHYLPFNMVAFDEMSKLRNYSSKRVSAMLPLIPYIERRMGMTGTPAPNGLDGLFSQMLLIDGGARLGTDKGVYHQTYFAPRMNTQFEKYDPTPVGKTQIFHALSDITSVLEADKFPTQFNDVTVQLSTKLMKEYADMEKDMLHELASGHVLEVLSKGVLFGKTLQFANGAMYLAPESPEWEEVHKEKLEALDEIVYGTGDAPLLLAYSFQSDIERIIDRYGSAVEHLSGKLSDADMVAMQGRWDLGKIKILAGHPASIGHGLNFQHGGHHIVWFGVTPDLELYNQMNARLPRRGQQNDVVIHRILAKDTVDTLVVDMLDHKAESEQELLDCVRRYGGAAI